MEPRTSFNVGVISGGTSVNTIAAEASLQLDLRSVSPQVLGMVSRQVEAQVEIINKMGGDDIHVGLEVIGERLAGEIPADHPLVKLAIECHDVNGLVARLNIGSTDANEPLSRGLPAICMGLTTGGGLHTKSEYIDVKPVGQDLSVLCDLVQALFREAISNHHP